MEMFLQWLIFFFNLESSLSPAIMPLISQVFYVKNVTILKIQMFQKIHFTLVWINKQTVKRRKRKKVGLWREKKKGEMSKLWRCQRWLNSYFKLTMILLTLSAAYWLTWFHILFIHTLFCVCVIKLTHM